MRFTRPVGIPRAGPEGLREKCSPKAKHDKSRNSIPRVYRRAGISDHGTRLRLHGCATLGALRGVVCRFRNSNNSRSKCTWFACLPFWPRRGRPSGLDRSGCAFPGVALPRRCYVNRVTVSRRGRAEHRPLRCSCTRLPAERKLSPELSQWGWSRPRVHLSAIDTSQGPRGRSTWRIESSQYSKCSSAKLNAYHIPPTTGLKT